MSKDLAPPIPNAGKGRGGRRVIRSGLINILLVKDPLWALRNLQMGTVGMMIDDQDDG